MVVRMTLDFVASQFEEGFRRTSRFYAASNVWDCCDLALRSIEGTSRTRRGLDLPDTSAC